MEYRLTKDGKKAIAVFYKAYLNRRASGVSKSDAVMFNSCDGVVREIHDSLAELKAVGFVKENVLGNVELKDSAIIFMENKTLDSVKEWLSFGSQFIP